MFLIRKGIVLTIALSYWRFFRIPRRDKATQIMIWQCYINCISNAPAAPNPAEVGLKKVKIGTGNVFI
ncbi:hypothetical protein C7N43_32480 [Sphingobacteriales bacterium UPWRP_1]|nr:hypothetical protein C7N43_32480 [Sphingobacteriales bacterium UPWRP_1]